jgi:signal transduction histidine kinase
MATAGKGILMLDGKKISHFSNDQGLNSNYCESITIQNDSIFIGTRHGINLLRFDSSSAVSITNLSKTLGFPDQAAYALKVYLNRIYVLSDDGLTSHSLVEQNNPLQPPRVYIESLQANGISVPLNGKIEIPYNQNNVVIRFSCISFLSPNTNYFKYKLSGSDEDWKTTSASELNFASLQPGKYELRVIGFNALDIASGEPLTIAFTILPAWWNSTQFIVLSGFAIFLVVFFSIRYWIHLEKKKVREKEATLTQLAAVEMRALRAQMNPHFIFNSLNSIQHYILEQDKITAHSLLSRFSKLMRNVLDNSKEDHISLLKELETLKLYLDLEMIRFQDRFNYEIVIDPELETLTTMIPPMIIQPFVENAILHGVLPKTTDDGFISIHLERREQSIFCSVRDNGIGRKKANELHQFSEDEHQSHGLSITRERLQLHNKAQKHQHPIEFEFHDLFDARGIAMGTRVEIIIPALSTTQ